MKKDERNSIASLQAEIERLRTLLSTEQNAAKENVERLRAANAKLGKKASGWATRCGIAEAKLSKSRDELDWFRRREARVRDLRNATISSGLPEAVCFDVFEANNPKPGAGS